MRLEGWSRGPWFETPRQSAAPHHEVPVLQVHVKPAQVYPGASAKVPFLAERASDITISSVG